MYFIYSNFDEHHYKDSNRTQYTEPTPLVLDNFRRFSSNSTKFSVVNENAVGYIAFYANHSLDIAMDVCWLENAKYCFLQKTA